MQICATLSLLMNNKRLMVKLNQISSQYIGKIMYALFLMSILETLSFFVILSPSLNMARDDSGIITARIFTLALTFIAVCVWLTFQFGFAVMLLRMTRRQHVNLGYMFIGFKKFNPAGKVIMSFAGLFAILTVAARFITRFAFSKINPDFSFQSFSVQDLQALGENSEVLSDFATNAILFMGLFIAVLLVLSVVTLIHFVFVFQLHFDNPSMKTHELFKKSAKMMHKNVFRLILFALRSGGKQLVIAIVLALIVNFIPEDKVSGLSLLAFILNLIYFINLYTAMIRIYLTVPVLYEEILNPKLEIENQTESPSEPVQS